MAPGLHHHACVEIPTAAFNSHVFKSDINVFSLQCLTEAAAAA